MAIHIRRLRCVHSKIRHIPSSSICRITAKNGVVQHDVEQPHSYIYSLCNTLIVCLSHLIPYYIHALIRTHLFPLSLPPSISHSHTLSLSFSFSFSFSLSHTLTLYLLPPPHISLGVFCIAPLLVHIIVLGEALVVLQVGERCCLDTDVECPAAVVAEWYPRERHLPAV